MAYIDVKKFFEEVGLEDRVQVMENSTATSQMAAKAIGCEVQQIAKTLSFLVDDAPILIVAAGNVRIDNQKYKATFGQKAKMIPADLVEQYIGHSIGGVCPFAVKPDVTVYLDNSLKANEIVYPAAGDERSVIQMSIEELERYSGFKEWIDIGKA